MIAFVHRHRVRRRLVREIAHEGLLARIGMFVGRAVPATRALPSEAAGRATVLAVAGTLVIGTHAHGARALAAWPLGAVAGWRAGLRMHRKAQKARGLAVSADLPAMLDRMTTCVLAGMSVERALRTVAPGTPGELGGALTEGLRALDAGVPRARAYATIATSTDNDDLRALTAALARAERFGTSISTALIAYARELRARQRAAAEAESRTAPVKMIFPLVFCFLPAFVLLTIAPIAISAIRTIGGI